MQRLRAAVSWVVTIRGVIVLCGLVAVLTGFLLSVFPAVIPPGIRSGIESAVAAAGVDTTTTGVAACIGLYALYRTLYTRSEHADTAIRGGGDSQGTADTVESIRDESQTPVVGAGADSKLTQAAAVYADDSDSDTVDAVTDRLETVLVHALMERDGISQQEAQMRIQTGEWTDDRVAAAFLGDNGASSLPLWRRVYAWLYPARTFSARYTRTLDEVKDVSASAYTEYEPGYTLKTNTHGPGFDNRHSTGEEVR